MTNSNDALRAALGDKPAVEKIAILSNQDWPLARVDMAATLDMIHEIAVAAIYPASPVAPALSPVIFRTGPCQHRWSHAPTVGYYSCVDCGERHEHGTPMYEQIKASYATPSPVAGGDLREAVAELAKAPAISWVGTEDQQNKIGMAACAARRKRWGDDDCDERDGSCDECHYDIAEVLETPASMKRRLRAYQARVDRFMQSPALTAAPVEAAWPQTIGRLHLGDIWSDGDATCAHSHSVTAGHPLYWPEQMGEYDDRDAYCLAHAIEQAESDAGWCGTCLDREHRASGGGAARVEAVEPSPRLMPSVESCQHAQWAAMPTTGGMVCRACAHSRQMTAAEIAQWCHPPEPAASTEQGR